MGRQDMWLCVLDDQGARLLRGETRRSRQAERRHLDIVDSLENRWQELEHNVRTPQTGKEGHSDADLKHRRAEFVARYARDAAAWLERTMARREIESLDLFAPPRLLGALRDEYPAALSGRIREHRGDLGHLSPGALERHPPVMALFAPSGRR